MFFKEIILKSFRRRSLDKLLKKYSYLYKGVVFDIGGRSRGIFIKPVEKCSKWVFVDIEKKHNPDLTLDVADMNCVKNESVDVVSAIELFEHVYEIENGLKECYRILKKNGMMILSVPFLYPIHADPYDFQRWTKVKWERELTLTGFKIKKTIITGSFFSVFLDMVRVFLKNLPIGLRYFGFFIFYCLFPLCLLDNKKFVKKSKLEKYHDGYFFILSK